MARVGVIVFNAKPITENVAPMGKGRRGTDPREYFAGVEPGKMYPVEASEVDAVRSKVTAFNKTAKNPEDKLSVMQRTDGKGFVLCFRSTASEHIG